MAFVTALVYLLTITLHAPERAANINVVLIEMMMPILLAEFWIRPYKHKLEQQLVKQLSRS
ncbi:MAG: hypothetical protein MJK13_00350 [Pseudomonadales bacterium]|nr:hypothetical protein [Pseudomonadales bacterium]